MLGLLAAVPSYNLVPSAPGAPLHVSAPASSSAAPRVLMQVTAQTTPLTNSKWNGPMGNVAFTGTRKRDAAVNDETMRWYLSSIGTKRLLDKAEEIKLAMAVKELLAWDREGDRLEDELGRRPTRKEWAVALGFSGTDESLVVFESQLRLFRHAKERMINANLRLVVSIAKKYVNRGVNIADLIQEGSFGLITAVDKFNPDHSCRFSTYAHYWIKQAVTRAISDFSRPIRLPVHMSDCVNAIKRQRNVFWQTHGRAPTELELSSALGISEKKLRMAMSSSRELVSLESPYFINKASGSDDKSWADYIQDSAPKPEHQLEAALLREQLSLTLNDVLLPQEREIVCMRYGLDGVDKRSLEEMGAMYDIPKERVRQIEARAMRKLRRPHQHRHLLPFLAAERGVDPEELVPA